MHRTTIALAILILFVATAHSEDLALNWSEKILSDTEAQEFISFHIFKNARPLPKINKCTEYNASVGEGFNRETTVVWSCKLSVDPKEFPNLISSAWRPLNAQRVDDTTKSVCPAPNTFVSNTVYVSSDSLEKWDINDVALYANKENSEMLVCYKVLILP